MHLAPMMIFKYKEIYLIDIYSSNVYYMLDKVIEIIKILCLTFYILHSGFCGMRSPDSRLIVLVRAGQTITRNPLRQHIIFR